jgi:hypothetical protein
MTLKELTRLIQAGEAPSIEVHSFDPSTYLLFARRGEAELEPIRAGSGKTLQFPSRHRALVALAGTGLDFAEFVHRSVYSEMIGMDDSGLDATELRETVRLAKLRVEVG